VSGPAATGSPDFAPRAGSPDRALGSAVGIAIALPEHHRPGSGPLPVQGVFRLSKEEAAGVEGSCLNAVVVLVRQPIAGVCNPGQGALLFEDDLVDEGATVKGYFNLDLADVFDVATQPGTYRVSASILHHVSDIHRVEVA
jgi:hypothetical protein